MKRREFIKVGLSATALAAVPSCKLFPDSGDAGGFSSLAAAENSGRIELAENWKLASATEAPADGAAISVADYQDGRWHPIRRMPATVLEILQEDGVYPDLYVGMNLLEKVSQDLYRQDWWYRTIFKAPAGECHTLEFPGINYRA